MKTTLNAKSLKNAIKSAKIYATEKSPWPTCKNVKMEALDGGIILTSTDREKTAKAVIPCDVESPGIVLLSPAAVKTLEAVKKEAEDAIKDAEKAEALKREWGESVTNMKPEKAPTKKAPSKTAKKAPTSDASTATATNTTNAEKAPEAQAEATETAKEETAEKQEEKRVKIADLESSAPLATVTPAEPAPVESAPLPSEPSRAEQPSAADEPSRAEKPFEIGTYTTKKGKVKTAVKFNITPRPEWVEALKKAFYWEYNGTWNGSPRKLPEIFKH